MAYILGYFAADGNMLRNKRGAHYIEFCSMDRSLILLVKKVFNSTHTVNSTRRNIRGQRLYRIQFGSKIIFQDLIKLGMQQRKSNKLFFPSIPPFYLKDFVRGYFDGDGHVSSGIYLRSEPRKNPYTRLIFSGFTSGTKTFLEKLMVKLKIYAHLQGGTLYYSGGGHRLSYSIWDSRRLYNFMYNKAHHELYLKRKKRIFEKFFNTMGR